MKVIDNKLTALSQGFRFEDESEPELWLDLWSGNTGVILSYLFNTELQLLILHPFFDFPFTSPPMRKRQRKTEIMLIKQSFSLTLCCENVHVIMAQKQSTISRMTLCVPYFLSILLRQRRWAKIELYCSYTMGYSRVFSGQNCSRMDHVFIYRSGSVRMHSVEYFNCMLWIYRTFLWKLLATCFISSILQQLANDYN